DAPCRAARVHALRLRPLEGRHRRLRLQEELGIRADPARLRPLGREPRGQSAQPPIPAADRLVAAAAPVARQRARSRHRAGARLMGDILFLAHRIPYPPDRGDKIRSWQMLRHLAGLARVHLACFADDAADAAHLPALRATLGEALGEAHVAVRNGSRAIAGLAALATGKPVSLTLFDAPGL